MYRRRRTIKTRPRCTVQHHTILYDYLRAYTHRGVTTFDRILLYRTRKSKTRPKRRGGDTGGVGSGGETRTRKEVAARSIPAVPTKRASVLYNIYIHYNIITPLVCNTYIIIRTRVWRVDTRYELSTMIRYYRHTDKYTYAYNIRKVQYYTPVRRVLTNLRIIIMPSARSVRPVRGVVNVGPRAASSADFV